MRNPGPATLRVLGAWSTDFGRADAVLDTRRACGLVGPTPTATVDRLLHHAHVCQTSGDSVRLTQALAGKGVTPLT